MFKIPLIYTDLFLL